ncbi:hypothetical protein L7F22_057742 [Adiantum nelumboides]|nr:hypothetical protein [Adiantum nelumboides]
MSIALELAGKPYDLSASSNASQLTIRLANGCSKGPRYVFNALECVKLQRGSSEHPSASRITIRLALELADNPYDLPTSSNAKRITKRLADGCSKDSRCVFSVLNCVKLQRGSFEHPSASRITIWLALELAGKPYDLPPSFNASRLTVRLSDVCSKDPRCVFSAFDYVKSQRRPSKHSLASRMVILRVLHLEKVNEDLARLQSLGGQLNVDKCHIAESQVTLLGHVVSSRGIEADPGKVQTLVGLPSPKRAKELVSFIQKVRYLSRFIHLLSQVVLPLQQLTHSNTFSWSEENEQQFNEIKELLSSLPTIAPPRWEETFYVNPSMGSDSIGAVLMQKDGESSFMRPIYFVSRVMTPLEKDYTVIEQMVMALMFAVGRFRSYLLPNKFVILTVEDTFSLVLQHMDVSARISKWLVRLQEFEYTVQVESSTQANLAGMLTHRCYERKVKVKAPRPKPVEVQAKLSGAHSLYFDGAYKRKVDKASVGISIQDENGQKVFGKGLLVENTHSNNEAEYAALTLGLEWCVSMGIKRLNVFGDTLLLIKQVHGTWACRNQSLVPRLRRVIEAIQLYHVPRKGNQEADALASEQLQEVIVGAIKLQNPLFQGSDCMHDIVNFLETGECPQDMSKGQ